MATKGQIEAWQRELLAIEKERTSIIYQQETINEQLMDSGGISQGIVSRLKRDGKALKRRLQVLDQRLNARHELLQQAKEEAPELFPEEEEVSDLPVL